MVCVSGSERRWLDGALGLDVVVSLGTLLTASAVIVATDGPARIAAAMVVTVLAPGYALTTALFPAVRGSEVVSGRSGLGALERFGLSLGLSVLVTAFVGLGLDLLGLDIASGSTLLALVLVSLVTFTAGVARRSGLPRGHRYVLPVAGLWNAGLGGSSSVDRTLNVGLVAVAVISVSLFGYGLVAPQDGTSYTSARLLTETPNGSYATAGYDVTYGPDERESYVLALENREGSAVEYETVVALQEVTRRDGETVVLRTDRLRTIETEVGDGETVYVDHEVSPTMTGDDLRVVYMVYRGDAPANPTVESAYRYLELQITVDGG